MESLYPLSEPLLDTLDAEAVSDAVKSGWLTQAGSEVAMMENSLRDFVSDVSGRDLFATSTSNGTTALHLALLSLGVTVGDEVILANFSYIAPVHAVIYCGATPILLDIDSKSWCLDVNLIKKAISPRTKAVIVVDNYGALPDINQIKAVVPKGIPVIQDAAESFPGIINGAKNRFYGDLITTSFYANKVITSAEGGAVFASMEHIRFINILKNQAVESKGNFEHVAVGYNYRISNLHAALFNSQWKKKNQLLELRTKVFEAYLECFENYGLEYSTNLSLECNPWLFTVYLPQIQGKIINFRDILKKRGIETRTGFKLASEHSHLNGKVFLKSDNDRGKEISGGILSLPTYPRMNSVDVKEISKNVVSALQEI